MEALRLAVLHCALDAVDELVAAFLALWGAARLVEVEATSAFDAHVGVVADAALLRGGLGRAVLALAGVETEAFRALGADGGAGAVVGASTASFAARHALVLSFAKEEALLALQALVAARAIIGALCTAFVALAAELVARGKVVSLFALDTFLRSSGYISIGTLEAASVHALLAESLLRQIIAWMAL